MTPKGVSLHIGLNKVDPGSYQGWSGQLRACEADANCMLAIAREQNYSSSGMILTQDATADTVLSAIKEAAAKLQSGDLFLLTYSGHGGRIPDPEMQGKQVDTWVLYDRMVISHELYRLWSEFAKGVRIFMLSDSCHSGSMARLAAVRYLMNIASAHRDMLKSSNRDELTRPRKLHQLETQGATLIEAAGVDEDSAIRAIDPDIELETYSANKEMYDRISKANPATLRSAVTASVLLISGCKDEQTSADGARNGLFTAALLSVWNRGQFAGNYVTFHEDIITLMPDTQQPVYFPVGATSSTWEADKPFMP